MGQSARQIDYANAALALSVPHFLAIPLIIAESDLVVTVPYAVARSFAKLTELKLLRPPIKVPPADIKQHWHTRFHHDEANKWLRGVVASLFVEEPRRPRQSSAALSPPRSL